MGSSIIDVTQFIYLRVHIGFERDMESHSGFRDRPYFSFHYFFVILCVSLRSFTTPTGISTKKLEREIMSLIPDLLLKGLGQW